MSCNICPSRLAYTKMTYATTISACSGSVQATAVGCKRVLSVLFLPLPGRPKMVKLGLAAQPTLPAWYCLLELNMMFSPSSSGLSP